MCVCVRTNEKEREEAKRQSVWASRGWIGKVRDSISSSERGELNRKEKETRKGGQRARKAARRPIEMSKAGPDHTHKLRLSHTCFAYADAPFEATNSSVYFASQFGLSCLNKPRTGSNRLPVMVKEGERERAKVMSHATNFGRIHSRLGVSLPFDKQTNKQITHSHV